MSEGRVLLVDPGITRVDLRWRGLPGQIGSYLVADGDSLAVVEPGPERTLPELLRALAEIGRSPGEITHILVTHVHLDHAGGAGALAELAFRARVHVHPRGAPHLLDPARLLASAARIYGDRMEELWGGMRAVPPERLRVLHDGEEVRVGARALQALDTPGHAWHHHAYWDADAALLFGGDVTGIRLTAAPYVRPPTPPPDLHVDRWVESLRRLRALHPRLLLPTHFGAYGDAAWHLDDLEARLRDWTAWGADQLRAGADLAALARALAVRARAEALERCGSEAAAEAYEAAVPSPMLAAGLHRYLGGGRAVPASEPTGVELAHEAGLPERDRPRAL